jgi:hypothetical protein
VVKPVLYIVAVSLGVCLVLPSGSWRYVMLEPSSGVGDSVSITGGLLEVLQPGCPWRTGRVWGGSDDGSCNKL